MTVSKPFDQRHPWLLHSVLLTAAVLTYFFDAEDVVWRLIKTSQEARALEHLAFGSSALCLALSIWFRTVHAPQTQLRKRYQLSGMLYALALGTLLPVSGFVLLVAGEATRLSRKAAFTAQLEENASRVGSQRSSAFWRAFVLQPGPCCAFASMLIFSITLNDSHADVLFAVTALVAAMTHLPQNWRACAHEALRGRA